jgi:epoxyqueuosine reductase
LENEKIIKKFAKENNIIVGICNADKLEYIEEYLNNTETPFVQSDIQKRINPKLIMSDAQSIIVIGVNYNKKINVTEDDKVRGNFSITAIDEDYHINVINILKKLSSVLNISINDDDKMFKGKIFCDTGDLIERELAKKAGIGVLGLNCSIISKKFGSMFNIGYIVTNMKLTPSVSHNPFKIGCYNCGKCILACPTSALSKEVSKFDYTKCISYITQKKGFLSDKEIKSMGTQIYGCDICQKVCPHNINTEHSTITEINLVKPELNYIASLTNKEFVHKYKKTSCGWRGKKILKRNALIALSNIGDQKSLEILKQYENDDSDDIKIMVNRLLQKYKKI